MPALPLLVIARQKEDRSRMAYQVEEVALPKIEGLGLGHRSDSSLVVIHAEGIAQINEEIGLVGRYSIHGLGPGGSVTQHDVHMRVGSDIEGEPLSKSPLGPEGSFGAGFPGTAGLPVLHAVVVFGVRLQPTYDGGMRLTGSRRLGGGLVPVGSWGHPILIVVLDGCIWNDLDAYGGVGRPAQQFLARERDGGVRVGSDAHGAGEKYECRQKQNHEDRNVGRFASSPFPGCRLSIDPSDSHDFAPSPRNCPFYTEL